MIYNDKNITLIEKHTSQQIKKNLFPGYKIYRSNHLDKTAHADSAIIISSNILHQQLPNVQLPVIQVVNFQIKINHKPLTILSVNCPPYPSITKQQPPKPNHFFNTVGNSFLMGGDFNAKH